MKNTWIVRTNNFKESILDIKVIEIQKSELWISALKKLGLFWLIALFCVFIPGLHFVLVPGFLLFGIYAAKKVFDFEFKIADGQFVCPECSQINKINNLFFTDGYKYSCEFCQTRLSILKK